MPIAFYYNFITTLRENEVLLHVQSETITKQLCQQWEFQPAFSAGLLYTTLNLTGMQKCLCVIPRAQMRVRV